MKTWLAPCFGILIALPACGGSEEAPLTPTPAVDNSSHERLARSAPVEKVEINIGAERSGHSLVVKVHGVGRGHGSGGEIEDPTAWRVSATHSKSPLRKVLAGPAKVSRAPTGAAMGDQWNIEVQFMIAFALPDRAGSVEVRVEAPTGETTMRKVDVPAPEQKLSLVN